MASKTSPSKSSAKKKTAKTTKSMSAPTTPMTISEIDAGLIASRYIPTRQISFATAAAVNNGTPVLLEGPAGVGKTYLAKSVASMLGIPLVRVQFYEGLTSDQLLFDYDYQKQLLTIQSIAQALSDNLSGKSIDEAVDMASKIDFYSNDFLIERPLLRSINGNRCVLLLDEVDKASEEIEYALLEFLEDYSISIPQLGTITCPDDCKPIVFLTSNRYRELSDALKRRCAYLYIPQKTEDEIYDILIRNAAADEVIVKQAAKVLSKLMSDVPLNRVPSIAEGIEWVNSLESLSFDGELDVLDTMPVLLKSENDVEWIRTHESVLKELVRTYADYKSEKYRLSK